MSVETYRALIESIVTDRASGSKGLLLSDVFSDFATGLLLDDYDLDVDEIESGYTDGGGDGQVDAMYVLVNGVLLSEADEEIPSKGPLDIDIILIQCKYTDGFSENCLKLIRSTVADLIDIGKIYNEYLEGYSEIVQDKFSGARKALIASAGRTARIRVKVMYATKGSTANIHKSVKATMSILIEDLKRLSATHDVEVIMIGAEGLISLSRKPKTRRREILFDEAISSSNGDSFACLVSFESLMHFLCDEKGELVRALFDANVRDFLGKTEVNESIRNTLVAMGDESFWWYNNGVTIIATEVDQKGKKLVLTEALLVNGLQTSNVLHSFFTDSEISEELKKRRLSQSLLVKVIVPTNEGIRDEIVKATNSQTHIPKPYLRGMDLVHRNIEDHLKSYELFYERRKNQYRNIGKARASIITLTEMAQTLMAALLFRGSDARARPTSLLKSDEDYRNLFSIDYHLDVFSKPIILKRRVITTLIEIYPDRGVAFRNDIIYHIIAFIAEKNFVGCAHAASGWPKIEFSDKALQEDIARVVEMFDEAGGTDRVAKSATFKSKVSLRAQLLRVAGV